MTCLYNKLVAAESQVNVVFFIVYTPPFQLLARTSTFLCLEPCFDYVFTNPFSVEA